MSSSLGKWFAGFLLIAIGALVFLNRFPGHVAPPGPTPAADSPQADSTGRESVRTEELSKHGLPPPTAKESLAASASRASPRNEDPLEPVRALLSRYKLDSSTNSVALAADAIREVALQEQDRLATIEDFTKMIRQSRTGTNLDSVEEREKQQDIQKRIEEIDTVLTESVKDARKAAVERLSISLGVSDESFFDQLFAIQLPMENSPSGP